MAIRKAGDDLKVANLNKENYPTYTFSIDPSQSVDVASSAWTNYFLAAYKVRMAFVLFLIEDRSLGRFRIL